MVLILSASCSALTSARRCAQRAPVAYHEAGHAVVARLLKFNVNYVTLKPVGDADGHCFIYKVRQGTPEEAEAVVIQAMASQLAQAKYIGDPTSDGSHADDQKVIAKWLRNARRSRESLGEEAVALVQTHWAAISDVAQELLRCETNQRRTA